MAFICEFYVATLVVAKRYKLAEEKLVALSPFMKISATRTVEFGFN